jgi:hypothetical protein
MHLFRWRSSRFVHALLVPDRIMADTEQVCIIILLYLTSINVRIRNRKRNERPGTKRNGERRQRRNMLKSENACKRMKNSCVKVGTILKHYTALIHSSRKEARKEEPDQRRAKTHRNNEGTRRFPRN